MKTIYKYPFAITDKQLLPLPSGRVLLVDIDPTGQPCLWIETDIETCHILQNKRLFVVGTGGTLPMGAKTHIGSFVQSPCVWHIYLGEARL